MSSIELKVGFRKITIGWILPEEVVDATKREIAESEGYNRAVRDILLALGRKEFNDVPIRFRPTNKSKEVER